MGRAVGKLAKVLLAGILAVGIISLFLCIYSLTPVHIENTKKNTDYIWTPDSVWTKMTEGIAWGRFDHNGYNNLTVVDNPDILLLGSSHMEATNVRQDQNTATLLNELLGSGYSVYNMAISGHDFAKVCQYLPNNMELYETAPKVTVIEISSLKISDKDAEAVLNHTVERAESHSAGLIGMLQKVPFLRMVYQQVDGGLLDLFMSKRGSNSLELEGASSGKSITVEYKAYDKLFSYLSDIEKEYRTEIILLFHPFETLLKDGTVDYNYESEFTDVFVKSSQEHDITFINMADDFEKMYLSEHHLAHGFITGELGSGHINAYGHRAMAKALADEIQRLEESGKLCK